MNASSFDRLLAASGKTTLEENPGVRESLLAVSRRARLQSNRPRRRVPHLVPILAISGLALTGGASVWVTSVQPDVPTGAWVSAAVLELPPGNELATAPSSASGL